MCTNVEQMCNPVKHNPLRDKKVKYQADYQVKTSRFVVLVNMLNVSFDYCLITLVSEHFTDKLARYQAEKRHGETFSLWNQHFSTVPRSRVPS